MENPIKMDDLGGKPPKWMVKIMENLIKMDDLGVPPFKETPIYSDIQGTFWKARAISFSTLVYLFFGYPWQGLFQRFLLECLPPKIWVKFIQWAHHRAPTVTHTL